MAGKAVSHAREQGAWKDQELRGRRCFVTVAVLQGPDLLGQSPDRLPEVLDVLRRIPGVANGPPQVKRLRQIHQDDGPDDAQQEQTRNQEIGEDGSSPGSGGRGGIVESRRRLGALSRGIQSVEMLPQGFLPAPELGGRGQDRSLIVDVPEVHAERRQRLQRRPVEPGRQAQGEEVADVPAKPQDGEDQEQRSQLRLAGESERIELAAIREDRRRAPARRLGGGAIIDHGLFQLASFNGLLETDR